MATQEVLDAVVVPQSQGTGLGSEDDMIDAASAALLSEYAGGEYVGGGMGFQNHNASSDTVDVAPGYCFVTDDSTSTSGERGSGGNAQVQSTSSSGYDTELPTDQVYLVIFPTAVTIACSDSTLNQVWVNIMDVTSNNAVEVRSDGGGGTTGAPSDTFLKLGEANPDDSSADTRANDYEGVLGVNDPLAVPASASAGSNSLAVGTNANAGPDRRVAVGDSAEANARDSVAVGYSSEARTEGVAIGPNTFIFREGVVIGEKASAGGGVSGALAIGRETTVNADNGVVIGNSSTVDTANVGRINVDQLVFGGVQDTVADADLNNEELTVEADEGNSQFVLRYKDSNGTVQTATVAFS